MLGDWRGDGLVEAADAVLYEAKAPGRNTFTVHPSRTVGAPAPAIARQNAALRLCSLLGCSRRWP